MPVERILASGESQFPMLGSASRGGTCNYFCLLGPIASSDLAQMRRNDQLGVAEPEHVRSRVLRKRTRVAIVFEPEPDKEQAQLDLRRAEVFDVYKEPQTPLYLQMMLGQKLFPNRFRQIRQVSRKLRQKDLYFEE